MKGIILLVFTRQGHITHIIRLRLIYALFKKKVLMHRAGIIIHIANR